MTDDVKELLGRAFGQEPPLRIDRDEVLQQGRKRLRRRRVFEASSVVAAVVVTAVGAAWLTNLADSTPQRMPPAATSTAPAPNGPELPLSPPQTTTTTTGPPSVSTDTSYPTSKVSPSGEKALQLTELLYDSGVMASLKTVDPVPGGRHDYRGMPAFKITGDGAYLYEADVRSSEGPGFVQVAVDYAKGEVASCDRLPFAHTECSDQRVAGKPMVLARWDSIDGERRYIAFAVLADGTRIAALASNTTKSDQKSGKKPDATRQPVLGGDDLCSLIAKSGFSVY